MTADELIQTAVPWWLVVSLRNRFYLQAFVELGAGYGHTSAVASKLFRHVVAVEIDPDVYANQVAGLKTADNAIRICGDTVTQLPNVLKQLTWPTLWYIDSHWPGMGPKRGPECPLLDELALICRANRPADVVLIDNAGMFIRPPLPPHDPREWPHVDEIAAALSLRWKWISVVADVIVATPDPLAWNL